MNILLLYYFKNLLLNVHSRTFMSNVKQRIGEIIKENFKAFVQVLFDKRLKTHYYLYVIHSSP